MNRRRFLVGTMFSATAMSPTTALAQESTPQVCPYPTINERDGVIVVEGQGNRLSEAFELEEGRYRIEMEFSYQGESRHIAVSLHTPDGDWDLVYNDSAGETFASTLTTVRESGECYLEVETSGNDWKIGVSPL